ncbi:MAG: FG-GAP-like repeat-containing protein [Planctomycetota bacterium]
MRGQAPQAIDLENDRFWQTNDSAESEVFLAGAEKQLAKLATILDKPQRLQEHDFASFLSPGFTCGDLLPDPVPELHRDGNLTIAARFDARPLSTESPASRHEGPSGLADALANLLGTFGEVSSVRSELRILRTKFDGASAITKVLFSASSIQPFRGFEQHALWICGWDVDPGRALPTLAWIQPLRYEQVSANMNSGTLYSDCTASAFSGDGSFSEQILPGLNSWQGRIQRGFGMNVLAAHGLAIGDVNGDELEDLFLCQPGGLPNRLYLAKPDGTVSEQSATWGLDWLDPAVAALILDLDNDGDQDLALLTPRTLCCLENDGNGHFAVRAEIPGLNGARSLTAADYDLDGNLDLFICGFGPLQSMSAEDFTPPTPIVDANNGGTSMLLKNGGNWRFHDGNAAANLSFLARRWIGSAAWSDVDGDGDPDLLTLSPFGSASLLLNEGGKFRDIADQSGLQELAGRLSASFGDVDNDGRVDMYLAGNDSALGYRLLSGPKFASLPAEQKRRFFALADGGFLYLNQGNGVFKPRSRNADIQFTRHAEGSCFLDMNQDGLQDLFVINGWVSHRSENRVDKQYWNEVVASSPRSVLDAENVGYRDAWRSLYLRIREGASLAGHQRHCCFLNLGDDRFGEISATAGLDFLEDARGVARVDWDFDGDQDLWIANATGPQLRMMRNDQESGHHFLMLKLRGSLCNRDSIGARVTVELSTGPEPLAAQSAPRQITRTLDAGDGSPSQSSKWLHFGLGGAKAIERVLIHWPGGNTPEIITGIERNGFYHIQQGTKRAERWTPPTPKSSLSPRRLASPPTEPARRIPLGARLPLPGLELFDAEGNPISGFRADARPTLLVLKKSTPGEFTTRGTLPSEEPKQNCLQWNLAVRSPGRNLAREDAATSPPDTRNGSISEDSIQKLDLLQRSLTETITPLVLPAAFLLDSQGELAVFYRGDVDPAQLRADVARLVGEEPRQMADFGLPFPGIWRRFYLDPGYLSLATTFRDAGNASDAEMYEQRFEQWRNSSSGSLARSHSTFMSSQSNPLDLARAIQLVESGQADETYKHQEELLLVSNTPWIIQTNIGVILMAKGEFHSALKHLEEATRQRPKYAAGIGNLGLVNLHLGRVMEGVSQLKTAVAMGADDPTFQQSLAWTLATHPEASNRNGIEAVQLAKSIARSPNGRRAVVFDVLAAAYAEAGNFKAAVDTANQAILLAEQEQKPDLANDIRGRLELFQKNQPYRQSADTPKDRQSADTPKDRQSADTPKDRQSADTEKVR